MCSFAYCKMKYPICMGILFITSLCLKPVVYLIRTRAPTGMSFPKQCRQRALASKPMILPQGFWEFPRMNDFPASWQRLKIILDPQCCFVLLCHTGLRLTYLVKNSKFKFKIDDMVRIQQLRGAFEREYDERWSGEHFVVKSCSFKQGIPIYELQDIDGEDIKGCFNQQELQK